MMRERWLPSAAVHSLGLSVPLTSTRRPFLMASNDERLVFFDHFSTVMSDDWLVVSPDFLEVDLVRTARAKRMTLASAKLRTTGSVAMKPRTTVLFTRVLLPRLAVRLVLLASIITMMLKVIELSCL